MVNTDRDDASAEGAEPAREEYSREPNKISATTKYSFTGRNLTAYGALLPVAAMLEKLEFRELVGTSVNLELQRMPRAMPPCDFLLGMILAVYVGFSRLNHLQDLEREPMLLGILRVPRLPVQSTFWRFLSCYAYPGVYHLYPTALIVAGVSRGNAISMRPGNRSDLAVELADCSTSRAAPGSDYRVGSRRSMSEGLDAAAKILLWNALDCLDGCLDGCGSPLTGGRDRHAIA
ncbi:MAG: hypothetical protein ACK6DY_16290 [Acidobacteriota bacterium]